MQLVKKYYKEIFLIVCWVIIQIVLYQIHGVKLVNDTKRYLNYAESIKATGFYIDRHNIWYFSYVFFLYVITSFGISMKGVVFAQILLSGFSFFLLSTSLVFYTNNKNTGYWLAFLLIGWMKISEWNFYIMTESLYISLCCLGIAQLIWVQKKKLSYLIMFPISIFIFFCRPTGLGFILAMFCFILISYYQASRNKQRFKIILGIISVLGIFTIYHLLNIMLHTFNMIDVYERAELVYAYGTLPNPQHPELLLVDLPKNLLVPSIDMKPIDRLISFVWYNPLFFFKLAVGKMIYFLGNVKPYFSWQHNVFIMLFLYPVYWIAIKAFRKSTLVFQPFKGFLSVFVLFNVLVVVLATEDWDGRFLLPVLPIIFLFAAIGLSESKWLKIKEAIYISFFNN